MLIQCQGYHGDYVYIFDGVAMLGGDRTGSSTQVPIVRRAWVPAALSYHARKCRRFLRSQRW
jgi:hypothetical protein